MTTHLHSDPNTETVAAAWASSPLGQLDHGDRFGWNDPAEPVTERVDAAPAGRRPLGRHALVAVLLAGGIAAGAALGLMSVDFTPAQSTVVVPATTAPRPAVIVNPNAQTPAPPDIGQAAAPEPVAPAPPIATTVGTPPAGPVGDPAGGVDVPAPADPPAAPEPADPDPQPPLVPELDFTLPEAQPDPTPPVFQPDLPKAPLPQPKPEPKPAPPSLPDFDMSAGPGS